MSPMPPTFHVQLFSPPTSDTPDQRSYRRLGSTQKLETLFLDLSKVDIISPAPAVISPRTRATRRKCQVFNFWSSSTGSVGSHCDFAEPTVEPYLPPSSSCTLSPGSNLVVKGNHSSGSGKSVKGKAGDRMKPIKSEGPQSLAQPYLLQLRSLPVPPTCTIKTGIPPVAQPKLLSPVSSSFNMDTTITTPSSSSSHHVLTDIEKRRKLAKLARILGENIPLEHVFPSPPPVPVQRATSLSIPRPRSKKSHKPFASLAVPPLPPLLPVPETPTESTENPLEQQRTERPRSMTLVASPRMATPSDRGALSTDMLPVNDMPFYKSTIAVDAGTTIRHEGLSLQWGRRKEKEWSGEWNVKDMERVAKTLRGLKAR